MNTAIKKVRKLLVIAIIVTLCALIYHIISMHIFNGLPRISYGVDETADAYMDIAVRNGATNTWLKRGYKLYGMAMDITGTTVDGVLHNNSSEELDDWTLTINIGAECFINQAWNGEVEIHQYVDSGSPNVQKLSLQNYSLDNILLDYLYDGDLLIPLHRGDYVVYYPSVKYKEINIAGGEEVTIGMIFYYLSELDISDYFLNLHYYRSFTQGHGFAFFVICLIALGVIGIILLILKLSNNRLLQELEQQKTGISCMSDIYAITYIINLTTDELIPVHADEESEKLRPSNLGAREQINNMFEWDATDAYKNIMLEFGNLDTIANRLSDKNSIACEYISKSQGWCRIRFFVMNRNIDNEVDKVLFTIQNIGDEKGEMDEIQAKVSKAEAESKAKSAFLANMSHEIRTPINAVLGFDTMIIRESKDKHIRTYAQEIKSAGNMLLSLINGILDFSKLEAGKMELVEADYSLSQMLFDVRNVTKARMEAKNLEYIFDISSEIPDKLYGDDIRLKQIIVNLLTNAAKYTESGSVKLSVYGKPMDDKVHMLISVRDTGIGIREEDRAKLTERFSRLDENRNRNIEGTGIGISLVCGLLELMDSELQVISTYGEGSEFYFELEQKVVDPTPIGEIDFENMEIEDSDNYESAFKAPDALIMVVDDNPMNLEVTGKLLKATEIQIHKANSGKEALSLCLTNTYDLIFMDHMMPEMDGIETFHAIKAQENGLNKNTPVVILTANALQGAKEEYAKEGFDGFLPKPVQPSALEKTIMNFVPKEKIKKGAKSVETIDDASENMELPVIEGVDTAYGVQHIGSEAGVLKMMKQFVTVAESDAAELAGYYEQLMSDFGDTEALSNYRIKVHAMKSSAALFGGLHVSGAAAQLEYAARDGAVEQIANTTQYFLEFWLKLHSNLKAFFAETECNDNLEPADMEKLKPFFKQLKDSMEAFDIDTADEMMEEITKYSFDKETAGMIEELKTAIVNIDTERAVSLCDAILG